MKKWHLKFDKSAQKDIKKLDIQTRNSIIDYMYNRISKLEYPSCFGKQLTGQWKGFWRYRVDKYRIVCDIQDEVLTILVVKIGKRDKIYED